MWRTLAFKSLTIAALVVFTGCGERTPVPLLEESSTPGIHGELVGLEPCSGKSAGPATGIIRLLSPADSSVVMEAIVAGSFELDVPSGVYQLEVAVFGSAPDRSFGALEFRDTLGYQLNGAYKLSHFPHNLMVKFEETVSQARAIEILGKEGASPIELFPLTTFLAGVNENTHASYTANALMGNYPNEVEYARPEFVACAL